MWRWGVFIGIMFGAYYYHLYRMSNQYEPLFTIVSMVKNEERILPRFLDAHKDMPMIFCDTGSTDNTIQLLQDAEYPVVERNWTGHYDGSRNNCLQAAMPLVWTPWTLLLDADHEIVWKATPTPPLYTMNSLDMQGYRMPYLVSTQALATGQCVYRGVRHEFLDCGPNATRGPYYSISLLHHADGGNRATKYADDLRSLTRAYEHDEQDPVLRVRYGFYIARTYEDLGNWTQAAHWYGLRAGWEGWTEEIYISLYRRGLCLWRLNQTEQAMHSLLQAYHVNPHRKEALFYLAQHARLDGNYSQCLLYSRAGLLVGSPAPLDSLFVEQWIYNWAMEDENALCLYYAGRKLEALGHWKRVLPAVPAEHAERIRANMNYINDTVAS